MTAGDVLLAVAARVPYLVASTSVDGPDWIGCDVLVAQPRTLVDVVRGTKAGFGTDDDMVAASLFTEAYAFRVAAVVLAAYALGLPVPDVAPGSVAVRIDKPRPSAAAYLNPETSEPDARALASVLLGAHLGPFVDSVHGQFRVGDRNLWGNVAAACAVVFRAIESSGADRAAVRDRASAFLAACEPSFDGLGNFTIVEHEGREGWYWDRTSCCLWFRTTGSRLCDNCSLIDRAELHERRVQELGRATGS
jgi:iron complex transport system ATP-binding protein